MQRQKSTKVELGGLQKLDLANVDLEKRRNVSDLNISNPTIVG